MKPIWVKEAKQDAELQQCATWISRIADINLLDVSVLSYPATSILKAYQKEGNAEKPRMYVPVQPVYMLESLAPEPNSEGVIEAQALKAVVQEVVSACHRSGIREVYFLCSDERVIKFSQHNGFDAVIGHEKDGQPDYSKMWLMRLKI